MPDDLPRVTADAGRIKQILRNLLQNAIMHTPAGGKATLSAKLDQPWVEVRMQDSGSGISPEHLPYIFDRCFRTDESRSRATGGSALGLSIVKQLVESHGGKVWAESEPGNGTTIHLTLPVAATT